MKKLYIFLLTVISLLVLTACGNKSNESSGEGEQKETISITHELDEKAVEVPKNPKTVVVFDFGMLDTLDKMGVDVAGLPKSGTVPPYLSKYNDDKYANVGSLKEPDFEKISELGPDLIIISTRQSELYEEFKAIAPTIYVGLDTNNYIESFKENVQTVAKIFGKEDMVKEEIAAIEKRIEEVNKKVTELGKTALIVLANDGKVSAYGPGSRFGLIHDVLGFQAVDENIEASTHGQSISFEYIVEKDPDFLFVIDRTAVVGGESSAKEVIENDLVKNTKAYKEGNIVYLDPNYWYLSGGGLVSVSEMILEVGAAVK